jgi:hypothetical protein
VSSRRRWRQIDVAAVVAWGRIVFIGPAGVEWASCVVTGAGPPDLAVVDALARLQLEAMRRGASIRLLDMGQGLKELLDLVGLRREVGGEAEGLEEVGVEESVVPGDPVA